ncbi:MAG: cobyrinate a,c-diamide synthase [Deltaproteobacteria bacterium]|nr:cobyrinate a,c-diamide synthase [Deltaproteobacteria bacterium]
MSIAEAGFPRVLIAGLAGDTGKSLVSLGLTVALRRTGLRVAPFKKGPDFIDAAWLGAAAAAPGRNLDTYLMPADAIIESLRRAALSSDVAVIEGNRGLFDGVDAVGSHSTAQLARLVGAPVVLVVDATKATRTVAAQVLGCRALDPDLEIAGVILNRVGTARQEALIREAVRKDAGVPVLGAIYRLEIEHLPSRHLGLVTPVEHPGTIEAIEALGEAISRRVDVHAVLSVARSAPPLPAADSRLTTRDPRASRVRIGVLFDKAFSFYYPENLSALQDAGAELEFVSPLSDDRLPAIDALYAGGGFPEEHAAALSANRALRTELKRRVAEGLPVWAECGGLMYLSGAIRCRGGTFPMVGALPVTVEQKTRPQGHGYVEARVDGPNAFLPEGLPIRGHEFHYSRLGDAGAPLETVLALGRGVGVGGGRDGIKEAGIVAGYTHVHALGTPEWAPALVRAARG